MGRGHWLQSNLPMYMFCSYLWAGDTGSSQTFPCTCSVHTCGPGTLAPVKPSHVHVLFIPVGRGHWLQSNLPMYMFCSYLWAGDTGSSQTSPCTCSVHTCGPRTLAPVKPSHVHVLFIPVGRGHWLQSNSPCTCSVHTCGPGTLAPVKPPHIHVLFIPVGRGHWLQSNSPCTCSVHTCGPGTLAPVKLPMYMFCSYLWAGDTGSSQTFPCTCSVHTCGPGTLAPVKLPMYMFCSYLWAGDTGSSQTFPCTCSVHTCGPGTLAPVKPPHIHVLFIPVGRGHWLQSNLPMYMFCSYLWAEDTGSSQTFPCTCSVHTCGPRTLAPVKPSHVHVLFIPVGRGHWLQLNLPMYMFCSYLWAEDTGSSQTFPCTCSVHTCGPGTLAPVKPSHVHVLFIPVGRGHWLQSNLPMYMFCSYLWAEDIGSSQTFPCTCSVHTCGPRTLAPVKPSHVHVLFEGSNDGVSFLLDVVHKQSLIEGLVTLHSRLHEGSVLVIVMNYIVHDSNNKMIVNIEVTLAQGPETRVETSRSFQKLVPEVHNLLVIVVFTCHTQTMSRILYRHVLSVVIA